MTVPETSRREVLEALLEARQAPAASASALGRFTWDSEEVVTLRRSHVITVLNKLVLGEWSPDEVEQWADLLEGRDDVGLEPGHEDVLKQVIFDLANPALQGPLDARAADGLMRRLTA